MVSNVSSTRLILSTAYHLDPRGLATVILFAMAGGLFDVIGVATIFPFLSIILYKTKAVEGLSAPEFFLNWINLLSLDILVFLYFIIFFLGILGRFFSHYLIHTFSFKMEEILAKKYLQNFFSKSFIEIDHLGPSVMKKAILNDTRVFIDRGLIPALTLISQTFIFVILLGTVLYIDFKNSFTIFFGIAMFYLIVFGINWSRLRRSTAILAESDNERFRVLEAVFRGVREIYIYRQLENIEKVLGASLRNYRIAKKIFTFSSMMPKYALEFLAVMAMLIYFSFSISDGSIAQVIPTVGLLAFVGYRLMPSLQQIYSAIVSLGIVRPYLSHITGEKANMDQSSTDSGTVHVGVSRKLWPSEMAGEFVIKLEGLRFPGSDRSIGFRTTNIYLGKSNLVKAPSGKGKTTLLDFTSGLIGEEIVRKSETIWTDPRPDSKRNSELPADIAYMPQDVFLFPGSVQQNITWGSSHEKFRSDLFSIALEISGLSSALACGSKDVAKYQIKENDFGLSGGQRKRVGVARVIYNDADLLLLDEPTAGLDSTSEIDLISSLLKYCTAKAKTVLIVSHSDIVVDLFENVVELISDDD